MRLSDKIHGKITLLCEAANNHLMAEEHDPALALFEEALALLPAPAEQWVTSEDR